MEAAAGTRVGIAARVGRSTGQTLRVYLGRKDSHRQSVMLPDLDRSRNASRDQLR